MTYAIVAVLCFVFYVWGFHCGVQACSAYVMKRLDEIFKK